MLDWLIVGGGIHGTHLAVVLLARCRVPLDRLRIVDPAAQPLERWRTCTRNTGMKHLRSPGVHHLDVEPWSLIRYGGPQGAGRRGGGFKAPYDRPALALFNSHCDALIDRHQLLRSWSSCAVTGLQLGDTAATVETTSGRLEARRVLLAIGAGDQPLWPAWAAALRGSAPVRHLFEPGLALDATADRWARIAVIGGGISAAQVALALSEAGRDVELWSPHPTRVAQFDSAPRWLGPLGMNGFAATPSLQERRAIITRERQLGSMPKEIANALRKAIKRGAIRWVEREVEHACPDGAGVRLQAADHAATFDGILLATGFEARRPGGAWLDQLVEDASLPCAACGYPQLDAGLRWHPRLAVTGPLAELELGPVARNIAGAQRAGWRLAAWAA